MQPALEMGEFQSFERLFHVLNEECSGHGLDVRI